MKPNGIEVRADKRRGIAEASGNALVLTSLWVGMGWACLYIADALEKGVWRSGILWWVTGVGLFGWALRDNARGNPGARRAACYHGWVFACLTPALVVLLDGATRMATASLGNRGLLISGVVVVVLAGCMWLETRSICRRLAASQEFSEGALLGDGRSRDWDPAAAVAFLRSPAGKGSPGRRLWWLISPLLPAVAIALSRNLSDDHLALALCCLLFFLGVLLRYGAAVHLGAAAYARGLDTAGRTRPL